MIDTLKYKSDIVVKLFINVYKYKYVNACQK